MLRRTFLTIVASALVPFVKNRPKLGRIRVVHRYAFKPVDPSFGAVVQWKREPNRDDDLTQEKLDRVYRELVEIGTPLA